MKTNFRYTHTYWVFLLILLLFTDCKKSEIPFYNDEHNAVRFPQRAGGSDDKEPAGYDELTATFRRTYSFVSTITAESYDYELPLELIGITKEVDRAVNYIIDTEHSTAPADSYQILKSVIPAGKRSGMITIRLFNTAALKEQEYKLQILLKPSQDLKVGPAELIKAELIWTARIPSPTNTRHLQTYNALIGGDPTWNSTSSDYYSPNALRVIVDALKWDDWDDLKKHGYSGNGSNYDKYKYLPRIEVITASNQHQAYALALAEYIEQYNAQHPDAPLLHDAGLNKGKRIEARKYN